MGSIDNPKMQSVWSLFMHGAVDSAIKIVFRERYAIWREKLAFKIAEKRVKKEQTKRILKLWNNL